MERNDDETPIGGEQALGGLEAVFDLAHFVVDMDAQRLKGAGGRIDFACARADGAMDDRDQLRRAADRFLGAGADDGAGDGPRPAFLALDVKDIGERRFVGGVDDIGRRQAGFLHPHVERAVGAEREPALGLVDLLR